MTLGVGREDADVEIRPRARGKFAKQRLREASFDRQKLSYRLRVSGWNSARELPRKVMVLGYFAETKGLVGCDYRGGLAFKVRELRRLRN
jgi:hypothetical protein